MERTRDFGALANVFFHRIWNGNIEHFVLVLVSHFTCFSLPVVFCSLFLPVYFFPLLSFFVKLRLAFVSARMRKSLRLGQSRNGPRLWELRAGIWDLDWEQNRTQHVTAATLVKINKPQNTISSACKFVVKIK